MKNKELRLKLTRLRSRIDKIGLDISSLISIIDTQRMCVRCGNLGCCAICGKKEWKE